MQMTFLNMATALGWWDDLNLHGHCMQRRSKEAGISKRMQRDLPLQCLFVCLVRFVRLEQKE